MATQADPKSGGNGGSHSGMVRAAVAAAATGAAAYGVRRLRSSHQDDDAGNDRVEETAETSDGDEGRSNLSAKREELTQALSTKVADAKNAASRLKPTGGNRRSALDSMREAASDQLLPIAGEAASSLGATVAKKAPDMVRDELLPRFIEGFEKTARRA